MEGAKEGEGSRRVADVVVSATFACVCVQIQKRPRQRHAIEFGKDAVALNTHSRDASTLRHA